MKIISSIILGLIIICAEVYLGVQTFYPELARNSEQDADIASQIIEQKPSILAQLPKEALEWLSQNKTVIIGTDPHFYPLETFDERGQYTGLAGDYVRILSHLTGINFHAMQNQSWAEAEQLAQEKKVDMFMAVVETERRDAFLDFTSPFVKLSGMVMAKRGAMPQNLTAKDLAGKKIAVVDSYFWHDYLLAQHPEFSLVLANNTAEALRKVSEGEADVVVDYAFNLLEKIQVAGIYQVEAVGEIEANQGHAIAVRKDMPQLFSIINIAFQSLTEEEKSALAHEWLVQADLEVKPRGSERRLQWYFFFFTQATLLCLGVITWMKSSVRNAVIAKTKELKGN